MGLAFDMQCLVEDIKAFCEGNNDAVSTEILRMINNAEVL